MPGQRTHSLCAHRNVGHQDLLFFIILPSSYDLRIVCYKTGPSDVLKSGFFYFRIGYIAFGCDRFEFGRHIHYPRRDDFSAVQSASVFFKREQIKEHLKIEPV